MATAKALAAGPETTRDLAVHVADNVALDVDALPTTLNFRWPTTVAELSDKISYLWMQELSFRISDVIISAYDQQAFLKSASWSRTLLLPNGWGFAADESIPS